MKQEEKTKRTKERILAAAMVEFGEKSYDAASINTICSESGISKGLLYHNFVSKEELYLQCVRQSYQTMMGYLKAQEFDFDDVQGCLGKMLEQRQTFFDENPSEANVFFRSLLMPPKHLLGDIQEIRQETETFYAGCYRAMLRNLTLREEITEEMALQYVSGILEMFNTLFQRRAEQGSDYRALIQDHEGKLPRMLDMMLYGIAKEER